MAIYKMIGDKEGLEELSPTSFGEEGILERINLQPLLRDKPEVLEEGLLIISEEFGNWADSHRRIDLLALDAYGRLVVIELKRGETGAHMELQALRYAAMVANMKSEEAAEAFQTYLVKQAQGTGIAVKEDEARTRMRKHLGIGEGDQQTILSEIPRIILASENFSKELTTCVLWLNDSWLGRDGLEIKCIRIQPHRNGNEVFLETTTVIPLPEASEYRTRFAERQQEKRLQDSAKSRRASGGSMFNESIDMANEELQTGLRRLYESALRLEEEELAELSTFVNSQGNYFKLELQVPGRGQPLVSFNNLLSQGGTGEISFWPVWSEIAPGAQSRLDALIGPANSSAAFRHRRLSRSKTSNELEAILTVIHDAYREAQS